MKIHPALFCDPPSRTPFSPQAEFPTSGMKKDAFIRFSGDYQDEPPPLSWVLREAIARDDVETLKQELLEGALPGSRSAEGYNMLQLAIVCGSVQVFDLLNRNYITVPDMEYDFTKVVPGSDVDELDGNGESALMLAARQTDPRCADFTVRLLKRGADADLRNRNQESALDIAQAHGNEAAVREMTAWKLLRSVEGLDKKLKGLD